MVINVQIKGLEKIQDKLKNSAKQLDDLTPFWQLVGGYIQKQTIKERFDKEQSPDGKNWKSLKKPRKGKILTDTGELRRSVQYETSKDSVVIGSNLKYARVHQFGSKKIPARPYLGVNESEKRHITQMLELYVKKHV